MVKEPKVQSLWGSGQQVVRKHACGVVRAIGVGLASQLYYFCFSKLLSHS